MLITTLASLIGVLVFLCAMLWATISDIRTRRVPNWLMGALVLCYAPLAVASGVSTLDIVLSFLAGAALLGAGMFGFSKGLVGAGDAKLIAASGLWLGWEMAPGLVLLSAFFALMILFAARVGVHLTVKAGRGHAALPEDGVPYGPAIAAAALLLIQFSPWTSAFS